jgi:hypothetical protein
VLGENVFMDILQDLVAQLLLVERFAKSAIGKPIRNACTVRPLRNTAQGIELVLGPIADSGITM